MEKTLNTRTGWIAGPYLPVAVRTSNSAVRFAPPANCSVTGTLLPDDKAADRAAAVLEADGWTVERPANPRIAIGTKSDNTFRVEFGPGAVVVQVTSECVETSNKVARDYAGKPDEDIVWK